MNRMLSVNTRTNGELMKSCDDCCQIAAARLLFGVVLPGEKRGQIYHHYRMPRKADGNGGLKRAESAKHATGGIMSTARARCGES